MDEVIATELELLREVLPGFQHAAAVVVLGSPVDVVSLAVARDITGARIFAVAQNASEVTALRQLGRPAIETILANAVSAFEGKVDLAVIRVGGYEGKENIRRNVAFACAHVRPEGAVLMMTHTKRGAKTQLAMLEEICGNAETVERGSGGFRILQARPAATSAAAPAEVATFRIAEELGGERFEFATNASVFSKERIDPGSRLLLEILPDVHARAILDFGCGYGVMGIVLAKRFPEAAVTMIDIDVGAVELARQNAELNGVADRTRVVLSDGLRDLPGQRFDLAVIHFPLHIPRAELERLLEGIHDALEPGGCLYGVMLSAYELRPLLRRIFNTVDTVHETGSDAEYQYAIVRSCRAAINRPSHRQ
jgi:16S rRNA (guanine1207-N2)-methyltransferase